MISRNFLEEWMAYHFDFTREQFFDRMHHKQLKSILSLVNWSNRCSFPCAHCLMVEPKSLECRMDDDVAERLLHEQRQLGSWAETYLYPQDPMQESDFMDWLERFPQPALEINPTYFLKDQTLLDRLWRIGVRELNYSLHGMPSGHKAITREDQGKWRELVHSFRLAGEFGFRLCINTCIARDNLDDLEALADVVASFPNIVAWWVIRVVPIGRAVNWTLDRLLIGASCGPVVRRIAKAFTRVGADVKCGFDVTWGPNYFGDTAVKVLGLSETEEIRGIYNCHVSTDLQLGLKNFLVSRYSSQVYPCTFSVGVPELSLGLYTEKGFQFRQEVMAGFLPENRLGRLLGDCSVEACPFAPICVGCRSVAQAFAKKLGPGSPIPPNVELDFCLTRYIYRNRKDKQLLSDLRTIILFPPVDFSD